ncbi:hypothetical protein [Desulforhopalus singaporensis]|uniref:Uncharacterized protein n=1 Tax=Desulforhopalus singaporensis TaxID=91360 RepID=A0A1H0QHU4_9BACT|nr:hypothetical protein [Desulforhopalus singaporensis]SDP16770.1 hypothetical protein SAMN05660330_01966 [Desulforhopalus singaporensis]
MQKIVDEIKKLVKFKKDTDVGDVVLIAAKEPQMLVYAYVTSIERDASRKDEWWHVQMAMLSLPVQHITWTLRTEQMTGQEIFTMGGEERFVQAVDFSGVVSKTGPEVTTEKKVSPLKRIK